MLVERIAISEIRPAAYNPRKDLRPGDPEYEKIRRSIERWDLVEPLVWNRRTGNLVGGHQRLKILVARGDTEVEVSVVDLDEQDEAALNVALNKVQGEWDPPKLAELLADLDSRGFDTTLTGFDAKELERLIASASSSPSDSEEPEVDLTPPAEPQSRTGEVYELGERHRLVCGDCRDPEIVARLFGEQRANLVVTSPPYAAQRDYDEASGFRPIRAEDYVAWYADVARNIEQHLAEDGSYLLNIKEHCEAGQRHLYVKDLTIAHVRQWGWRFVDEFCWRKTNEGVPGAWPNRFKNAWEPVFHFSRAERIKFRPDAVAHESEGVFDYSPQNKKSRSGSGLPAGPAQGFHHGLARPSNVIETAAERAQGEHSAPFPSALPAFFIRAFTDRGDIVFDPFMGSGTTLVAAHQAGRVALGCEISPAYCDVIRRRYARLVGRPELEP